MSMAEQMIERLPGGVAYLDADLVFRRANPALARFLRMAPAEIVGRRLCDVLPGAEADVASLFAKAAASGRPVAFEAVPVASEQDGEPRQTYWDATFTPVLDDAGGVEGWLALSTEVSERNETLYASNEELAAQQEELAAANEELRQQAELLMRMTEELARQRAFAEGVVAHDTTGIAFLDGELRYRMANRAMLGFLRMEAADVVGRTFGEVTGSPDSPVVALLRAVLDRGETRQVQALPLRYLQPDGSQRETYWDATYLPMNGAGAGGEPGVLVLATEVSDRVMNERLQAEKIAALQALASQRAFAEKVLANVLGGVAYLDRELVFRFANVPYSRFLGLTPAGIVGKYLDDVAPGAVEQTGPWLHEVMRTGVPFENQNFCLVIHEPAGDRNTYWDFVYYPDEPDPDGVAKGVFVLANEISEKLRAERERDEAQQARIRALEEANVHKEQFLSILSHELRTPINAIMGFASVLDDDVAGPLTEGQHAFLRKILDGSERMLALITDLLDMSRIQAGQFTVALGPVDLHRTCRDVLAALHPLAAQKGIATSCEAPSALPGVLADAQRIEQVLVNLVGNAIKFTPAGGRIAVRAIAGDGLVRVEVHDTGIGVAAEDQGRIFDAFTQVDMSNTRPTGGTGLGLAISRSLIEAQGGTIGVTSEPGAGSTFWFTLPVHQQASVGK